MTPLARAGALRTAARAALDAGPAPPERLARDVLNLDHVERPLAERLVGALLGGDPAFERMGDGHWRLAAASPAGAPRRIRDIPFAVVDVETTGGQPPADRVVEIAAVRVQYGRLGDEWSALVQPGRPIPWFVARLTGINDEMLLEAPPFEHVADAFLEFLGGATFVAHNARFDWRFVNSELMRASGGTLTNGWLCTVRLARRLLPHVRRRNLDALAHLFGVSVDGRHRALGDARATARILLHLLEVAEEQGLRTESDLADLAGSGGTLYPSGPY